MSIGVLALVLSCLFLGMLATPNKGKALMGVMIAIVCACILQLVIMIPMMIAGYCEGMWILYCFLGILICSGMIYFDLFIIMLAGKYAMDEYIYCALLLYVDIIRLLLYILMLFGKGK